MAKIHDVSLFEFLKFINIYMFKVYKIKNKITKKCYIGVTKMAVLKRWYYHKWKSKHSPISHFHRSIAKHGAENFDIEILCESNNDNERAIKEQYYIKKYDTYNNGYNSTLGGDDFTDSEYQKRLQKYRVDQGTHPFLGGNIQRKAQKALWESGKHHFIGNNQKRVLNGTHHFLGDSNPQKRLSKLNLHHNQKSNPWENTNISPESLKAWLIADQLYIWFIKNSHKPRGGSYTSMAKAFNIKCSLQVIYYKYFKKGWVPMDDPKWVRFASKN